MKLMILGAGQCQLNAIRTIHDRGHTVIAADYLDDAPGKAYSDIVENVSTFDNAACLEAAIRHMPDGIMTLGTDQPVYTSAYIADKLSLPAFLKPDIAKSVTNKKIMKRIFTENDIPTANYRIIKPGFNDSEIKGLKPPFVVKPLDSQGQRGVYRLENIDAVRRDMNNVLTFSREDEILIEEFYPSDEITVSGWVTDKKVHILTVTDRLTFSNGKHIGICRGHRFISKHFEKYFDQIEELTERITAAFEIVNGPIYYQMLIGDRGIIVNEIAARIGGAYEDIFMPAITGVDILKMLIEQSLGKKSDYSALYDYDIRQNKKQLSVHMLFTRPGKIGYMTPAEDLIDLPGVITAGYHLKVGDTVGFIEDARLRAAYAVVMGEDEKDHSENVINLLTELKINDEYGENMIISLKNS